MQQHTLKCYNHDRLSGCSIYSRCKMLAHLGPIQARIRFVHVSFFQYALSTVIVGAGVWRNMWECGTVCTQSKGKVRGWGTQLQASVSSSLFSCKRFIFSSMDMKRNNFVTIMLRNVLTAFLLPLKHPITDCTEWLPSSLEWSLLSTMHH